MIYVLGFFGNFMPIATLLSLGLTFDVYVHNLRRLEPVVFLISVAFFVSYIAAILYFDHFVYKWKERALVLPSVCTHFFLIASYLAMAGIAFAHGGTVVGITFLLLFPLEFFCHFLYASWFSRCGVVFKQSFAPEIFKLFFSMQKLDNKS